jgi:hypothetical protein
MPVKRRDRDSGRLRCMWISGTAWRAKVHLAALHAAVDEFREKSPYAFAMESPGNERWKPGIPITVTVTQAPPIPDDWALIGGDILTNVRADLDHAVFRHIRANKPSRDRSIYLSQDLWPQLLWHAGVDRPDNAIHLQRKVDDSYANGYGNSKWASEGAAA